ncbi:hypothetical protein DAEQUDRAFT_767304 [Daedalea quercina L-15889]|uniref:Uncharacterized protein n=1 Tax=Daedalea quercina L-15889 TaxID=1314783 RepID=A0A165NQ50_9APHY|nr:hypothetical protein DAEQUDRAFT_767304 [Daedalea quercina L-15889]
MGIAAQLKKVPLPTVDISDDDMLVEDLRRPIDELRALVPPSRTISKKCLMGPFSNKCCSAGSATSLSIPSTRTPTPGPARIREDTAYALLAETSIKTQPKMAASQQSSIGNTRDGVQNTGSTRRWSIPHDSNTPNERSWGPVPLRLFGKKDTYRDELILELDGLYGAHPALQLLSAQTTAM